MTTSTKKNKFFKFFLIFTIIVGILLIVRIIVLDLSQKNTKTYNNPVVSQEEVRGTIYDRNKKILAIDRTYQSLIAHPQYVEEPQVVASLISPYVTNTNSALVSILSNGKSYSLIQRKLKDSDVEDLKTLIKENNMDKYLEVIPFNFRSYPQNFHAAQIIGFTNVDKVGLDGIEYQFNKELTPTPQEDSLFSYGSDIYLTLDMDVQYLLDMQMQNMCNDNIPDYAVGMVMDAKTGEILASSSWPWFNLNNYNTSTEQERINNTFNSSYAPGSVFKVFSLASLLDIGDADFNTPFVCDGSFTFSPNDKTSITINCDEPHGIINGPNDMIKYSCNGAISNWALQTDTDKFYNYITNMNFGSSLPFDQTNSSGYLASPNNWSLRSKPTISFGQEISATALQLCTAATMFTNSGNLLRPSIIYKVIDENNEVTYSEGRQIIRNVLTNETCNKILEAMNGATEAGGTAVKCSIDGIKVAAKTGTSQILGQNETGVIASTLAIVDIDNPKYIIYMAAYNPQGGEIWGANIASPAIAKVIQGLISIGKVTN